MNKINLRKIRLRRKLKTITSLPILSVFRSNREIYAQIADKNAGNILASANSLKIVERKNKSKIAEIVGQNIAKAAKKAGIEKVAFDRGCNKYHGRVKLLAKGARDAGLIF